MPYEDFTYEYYKLCNACGRKVLCYIIATDEAGRERCPYCDGWDFGPVMRNTLCSLEAYLREEPCRGGNLPPET